jgi:hypothetical protein
MSKYSSYKEHQLITENWRKFLNEESSPSSNIRWSQSNQMPSNMRDDVYNSDDEKTIQQALGPDYYVVEFQYDMRSPEANQYFDKYVVRPTKGPNGEIVVMPQGTLERDGTRVHYFKMAHETDESGNMYAQLVS